MKHWAAAAMVVTSAVTADAAEVVLGLGYDDVLDQGGGAAFGGALELRSDPLVDLGPFRFGLGAAFEGDTDGDVWGGGGVKAYLPFDEGFRLTGGVMAGAYGEGADGNNLGATIEFRLQIGLDYAVAERWRVGAAFEHKSNAGFGDVNPGVETVYATLGYSF